MFKITGKYKSFVLLYHRLSRTETKDFPGWLLPDIHQETARMRAKPSSGKTMIGYPYSCRLDKNETRSCGIASNYRFEEHGFGSYPQATFSI
jgi:hypothetical protein